MQTMKCRIMIMRNDGIYFCGPGSLVKEHDNSKLFTDLEDVLNRIRDVILLSTVPVTQVRIVDEDW